MTALVPLTVPAEGPVTLATLRTYLRIDGSDDDAVLQAVLAAARHQVERQCGRLLCVQSWRMRLDAWPAGQQVSVPLVPFRRVLAARVYTDQKGATDLPVGGFVAAIASEPALVSFAGAPMPGVPEGGIEIDIEAGYANPTDVPAALTLAVLRLSARLYEARGDENEIVADTNLDALIAPFRKVRLA